MWGRAFRSEVEDELAVGAGAAEQNVACGRVFERVGVVMDGAVDQPRLAGVANPGPACPAHWYVAGFSELEEAAVGVVHGTDRLARAKETSGPSAGSPGGG